MQADQAPAGGGSGDPRIGLGTASALVGENESPLMQVVSSQRKIRQRVFTRSGTVHQG